MAAQPPLFLQPRIMMSSRCLPPHFKGASQSDLQQRRSWFDNFSPGPSLSAVKVLNLTPSSTPSPLTRPLYQASQQLARRACGHPPPSSPSPSSAASQISLRTSPSSPAPRSTMLSKCTQPGSRSLLLPPPPRPSHARAEPISRPRVMAGQLHTNIHNPTPLTTTYMHNSQPLPATDPIQSSTLSPH